ncbi:MAG: AAA family ATPase [Treponema sp.]|jgi:chromosome segregation protein|nr:AAA family ATPase [Treponema sp.]
MFLKSLDIFGFKSFAERTHIEFADGITALLGPNGCGKSNVVDAIKWVLGEQKSTAMRAEKMEDIIFNGTDSRKPLSVAEVTLILANDTKLLPLDMPEVQIRRRLFRSGESEYYINANLVKLKEVRELFWDTGVGKAAYSVMEQGKIDQVLSSKPDERRYLFEEAAGITKFKVKGREAELKLARTEENMRQVEGIVGEVKRSYDTLKVQADKTLKYRTLKDDVFHFELDIQLLRLKRFKNDRDECNENLRSRTEERDTLKAELDAVNKALEENMDAVNEMEERLVEYQKTIYALAIEKNAKEKEAKLLIEQRNESKTKIAQNEAREHHISLKIDELTDDADEQDAIVRDLRRKALDIEDNIRSFEENIGLASSRIGENEHTAKRAEEEIRDFERTQISREKDLEKITDDIVAALDAGLKDAGYSAAGRKASEAALQELFALIETSLSGREALARDLADIAGRAESDDALPSSEKIKRLAESIAAALSEINVNIAKAKSLFDSYRQSAPSFLDDFLAPEGIITKKRSLDRSIRSCKDGIEQCREKIANLRRDNEDLSVKIDEYRATLEELRVNRARISTQANAAEEKARLIRRELTGQETLRKTVQDDLFFDRKRFAETGERITDTEQELADIETRGITLTAEQEQLEADLKKRNGDLAGTRNAINKRAADMLKVQTALEKIHLEIVQSDTEIKNIQDNFRETHSRDLMEFEERILSITATPSELRESLAAARAALKDLGAVNLMAVEEFAETKERFEFLSNQLADLVKARDDLESIAAEIRAESSALFIATYNKIKKNFHNMFRRLFGGGRAELRLIDANHVLESGIEIFAQPPGKKLENIGLLSGGERSMTAVALLFATYIVKPSPFCLLDEIDAALDEANVSRFVQTLREFGSASQFIVITHNKKTMVGAATLLGVSMEEAGVTKVISVRLENRDEAGVGGVPLETIKEEDVELEEGRELPRDVDDPALVSDTELHPIRGGMQDHPHVNRL